LTVKTNLTVKTILVFAIGCALLGGCASAPYDDYARARHYGERRDEQRLHRDPIPYRADGDGQRGSQDRAADEGPHDQWR
jgi:hypothetical protein